MVGAETPVSVSTVVGHLDQPAPATQPTRASRCGGTAGTRRGPKVRGSGTASAKAPPPGTAPAHPAAGRLSSVALEHRLRKGRRVSRRPDDVHQSDAGWSGAEEEFGGACLPRWPVSAPSSGRLRKGGQVYARCAAALRHQQLPNQRKPRPRTARQVIRPGPAVSPCRVAEVLPYISSPHPDAA